ncbi:MAG: hypothetical protein KH501_09240 [Eubacterium limosum]|nr:hypothetical protein [Eubacterium limosum]
MSSLAEDTDRQWKENEKEIFRALDKGIDDLKNGRTMPHEELMQQIRKQIESYDL